MLLQHCLPHGRAALSHPLVLFLSPLGRPAASLVVARPQQFPLRPHGVMELFQLDLHLCLRSQWLRPHPHTSARRLRPWCTLPCKPWVHVYTLCIRYYVTQQVRHRESTMALNELALNEAPKRVWRAFGTTLLTGLDSTPLTTEQDPPTARLSCHGY